MKKPIEFDFLFRTSSTAPWEIYHRGKFRRPHCAKVWKELRAKMDKNEAFAIKYEVALPF